MDQKIEIPLSEKMKAIPGFFGIRLTEEPEYKVLKQEDDFEVREYGELLLATTLTGSTYETSSKKSFMRLANYIFGGNQTHKNMAMTSPVFIENKLDGWMMTFILSKDPDSKPLPTPEDKMVVLSIESSKKYAVMKYSDTPNESLMKQMAAKLKSSIGIKKQYRVASEPRWAQYDGPMVIPFLRRNEVQIEIESIQ
jgi:hypothetical protein